ncbi:FtsW/RodA/SpoVE family cell cycle protein [Rothia sp. P13129]|uniref:FtsW/RodA/SpoVE family cell cycle protein n=1 Tax=Rothia sp. P13129 TaxID=3402664 RepID=UPI003AC9333F
MAKFFKPSDRPRTRRFIELFLTVIAIAFCPISMWLVDPENITLKHDNTWVLATGVLGGGALLIHTVLHLRARYADPLILPIVVLLNGLGLAMIYRIDLTTPSNAGATQIMWTALGMTVAAVTLLMLKSHRVLRRVTYVSLLVSLVLLLLPLIPFLGVEIYGARIWISIAGRTFQPGELAKITLAIFFAGYLSTHRDLILVAGRRLGPLRFPRFRDLAPMFIAWLASIGVLIFQRDLGSAILFFGLFVSMLYLATGRSTWVFLGLGFVALGGVLAYQFIGHVNARIYGWIHAFDPEIYNRAYGGSGQIIQGIFGLGAGGLFGRGWGKGRPDLVAFSNSDMIVTSLGEELGLVGLSAILLLYFLLITRGFRAALGTRDAFGKLLSGGLSAAIVIQLFVVVGGVTRMIPLTGLTTPFLSAGGSSLLANWIIIALLLSVSHAARAPHVIDSSTGVDGASDTDSQEGGVTRLISKMATHTRVGGSPRE